MNQRPLKDAFPETMTRDELLDLQQRQSHDYWKVAEALMAAYQATEEQRAKRVAGGKMTAEARQVEAQAKRRMIFAALERMKIDGITRNHAKLLARELDMPVSTVRKALANMSDS